MTRVERGRRKRSGVPAPRVPVRRFCVSHKNLGRLYKFIKNIDFLETLCLTYLLVLLDSRH